MGFRKRGRSRGGWARGGRLVWRLAVFGTGAVVAAGYPARVVNTNVTITATSEGQYPFQGWGTSLAWWANALGKPLHDTSGWSPVERTRIENLLFGAPSVNIPPGNEGIVFPNLGLNVVRYNIGASTLGPSACTHPFRLAGAVPTPAQSGSPDPATWNWTADANQIRVLKDADSIIRGTGSTPVYEAFANSPPFWMLTNNCPQGAPTIAPTHNIPNAQNALTPGDEQLYVDYLAQVVHRFRTDLNLGITFSTIAPFNEPNVYLRADPHEALSVQVGTLWPPSGCTGENPSGVQRDFSCQEGANFQDDLQNRLIPRLCDALNSVGESGNTGVSAPDGNSIDETNI